MLVILLQAALAVAAAYQVIALLACIRRLGFRERARSFLPGVSILKPIHGTDEGFYEAIRTHALIDYPEFELLFGVRDTDPAPRPEIERLAAEFPQVSIRIVTVQSITPNGKVGALIDLEREARHPILLVNDSDIRVEPDYLRKVVAPLENPRNGLVTCLYRALGHNFAGNFEALGVDTDFIPSALVAPLVGVDEFALGSTLAFRRSDLQRIGGFPALSPFIADDYQLGHMIHSLGLACYFAEPVVETHLGARNFTDVWLHQVRWARTIRFSRPFGYSGLPVTFATFWGLAAAAGGLWWQAAALLAIRLVVALVAGFGILRGRLAVQFLWLVPLRDLYAVAVWAAGMTGSRVYWRDFWMNLEPGGKIAASGRTK